MTSTKSCQSEAGEKDDWATWRAIAYVALLPDWYIIPRINVSSVTTSPFSSDVPSSSFIAAPPTPASKPLIVTVSSR